MVPKSAWVRNSTRVGSETRADLGLLGEILGLSRDPSLNLDDFLEKLRLSPTLAADVVRAADSALYGMKGKITRVERAVLILGARTVASIVSALVIQRTLVKSVADRKGHAIWMHSIETGVCAELVATCLELGIEADAYVAGLLHHLEGDALRDTAARGQPLAALVRAAHALVEEPYAGWKDGLPGDQRVLADLGLWSGDLVEIRQATRERTKALAAVFG